MVLPFGFSYQNFVFTSQLSHARYMSDLLILLDLVTLRIYGEGYKL